MAVRLVNAPIGLFEIDGVLVLKTEYCTKHEDGTVTADCYIVDSGEYFWGGVESAEERNNLMVTPVDMPTLTPPPASRDLISRSALLEGETEPEITTGSDSELAEHMEWDRWMDKIKRAPAVDKEEEP